MRTKMVALVRADLNMGVGKVAAQVSHATLGAYKVAARRPECADVMSAWESSGEPTIVLKVDDFEQLNTLLQQAETANLVVHRVRAPHRIAL